MKKMSASSYSLIVIMAIALVVIVLSLGMPFSSRLLPLVSGIAIFLLSAIKLRQEFSSRDRTGEAVAEDEVEKREASKATRRGSLLAFTWLIGFVLALYLLGFLVAIPLFIFSYMKSHGTRWRTSIIFTIVILAVVYFGFERGLDITLYRGLLFIWLDRLLM